MVRKAAEYLRQFIFSRRHAYNVTFRTPEGEKVLADLMHFCRASYTTFHTDPAIAALQEGRREVWLRIQDHLNLSPEELYTIATGQAPTYPAPVQSQHDEEDYV